MAQQTIRVQVPGHGIIEFPAGTSQDEMKVALLKLPPLREGGATTTAQTQTQKDPKSELHPLARLGGAVVDFTTGFAKGAGDTAVSLGQAVHKIPGVSRAVDTLYGQEGLSEASFPAASQELEATNNAQKAGKAAEFVAEMAIPVSRAVKAASRVIPTTAKAAEKFQDVMGAAKNVAVDVTEPGNVALRIYQLSERGGSMPKAVRDFLKRTTDPEKGAMTYAEARDFASNISRLSANEFGRLTPAIGREIHGLRVALNKAVAQAAAKVGKGEDYAAAMTEYARAKRLQAAWEYGKKWALPTGLAAVGAAYANKALNRGR